jgi:hypothetical protein
VTTRLDGRARPAVRDEVVRVVSGSLARAAGSVVRVVMIAVRVVRVEVTAGATVRRVVSGSRVMVEASVDRVVMIADLVVRVAVMIAVRVVSGSRVRAVGSVVRVVSGSPVKVEASVDRVVMIVDRAVRVGVMIAARVVMIAVRVVSGNRARAAGIVDRAGMIVGLVVMIAARAGTIVVMTFRRMKRSAVEPKCLPVKDHVSTAKTNRLVIGPTEKSGWLMKVRSDDESSTATNVRVVTLPAVSRVVTASRTDHCSQRHPRCRSHWRGKCVGQLVTVATSSSARSFHAPWWPTMPSVIAKHSACSRRCSKISG